MQLTSERRSSSGDHIVHFYADDDELAASVCDHLAPGYAAGDGLILIATPEHRALVLDGLAGAGVDVEAATGDGQLVVLDAAEALAGFVEDGVVDPERFQSSIGSVVRSFAEAGRAVRAYGEMVAVLWAFGQLVAVLDLEEQWNQICRRWPVSLLCGYPQSVLDDPQSAAELQAVCHSHGEVIGAVPVDAGAEITSSFARSVESAGDARRFVSQALRGWDLGDLVDDAALVVTELATNAMTHGGSEFTVSVSNTAAGVRIAVGDSCLLQPVTPPRDHGATTGRGLALVAALSREWGCDERAVGKLVWAELVNAATPARA